MRTRLASLAVVTAAAGLAGAPAAHAAATLTASSRCYQETQDVVVRGTGFRPGSQVTIRRNGEPLGIATANAQGAFAGKFATEELRSPLRERLFDLSAADGTSTALTRYRVTKVFADFTPGRGDPRRLNVRFEINGFGLTRRNAPVYVHYVRPGGKVRRTIRLGTARGTCGKIDATKRRRLFPFQTERGTWILQFDTRKSYVRATRRSKFVWVRKPVVVSHR